MLLSAVYGNMHGMQVLQQYGADFVSIQAVNTSTSTTVAARRLLTHSVTPEGAARRHLTQAGSSMLQISTLVTAPAEDQLQMLSPLCASKIAQSLGASGMAGLGWDVLC